MKKGNSKAIHYVCNNTFTAAVDEYVAKLKSLQKEQGIEKIKDVVLKPSDYIGEAIMKICNGLSHRPNFINYSYRDEFCFDGQLACIKALKNFNSEYGKAFGYFTQIAYRAFVNRINLEKKQQLIKYKVMFEFDVDDIVDDGVKNATAELSSDIINVYRSIAVSKMNEKDFDTTSKVDVHKIPEIETALTEHLL